MVSSTSSLTATPPVSSVLFQARPKTCCPVVHAVAEPRSSCSGQQLRKVQAELANLSRHASVTTTTGAYAHLAIEDLRDAVSRIGPEPSEPSPVADRLRTSLEAQGPQRTRTRAQTAWVRRVGWRAWQESNLRPAASKAAALSS